MSLCRYCFLGRDYFGPDYKCSGCQMIESNIQEWPCVCDMIQVFKPGAVCFSCKHGLNYKTNARVL